MNAGLKVGAYAVALVAVFAVTFGVLRGVTGHAGSPAESTASPSLHGDHDAAGLSRAASGYRLTAVETPTTIGTDGRLAFTVLGPDERALTDYEVSHERDLHVIVVRSDGTGFRHVHPDRDADGRWSMPWRWDSAGSYRIFADFVPAGGPTVTLSTMVGVSGGLTVADPLPNRVALVDGYRVDLAGDLTAGAPGTLRVTVTRDGRPVTTLQPYLGAFGHLVVLRAGDLAYLHAHPLGEDPQPGQVSGPSIGFEVTAPTPGRYLLYLDVRIDDRVHTAPFVLDVDDIAPPGEAGAGHGTDDGGEGGGHDDGH